MVLTVHLARAARRDDCGDGMLYKLLKVLRSPVISRDRSGLKGVTGNAITPGSLRSLSSLIVSPAWKSAATPRLRSFTYAVRRHPGQSSPDLWHFPARCADSVPQDWHRITF